MSNIVPISFQTDILPSGPASPLLPGATQGVHFTVAEEHLEMIYLKMLAWFRGRRDVVMVDHGTTDKTGSGFVMMDWIGGYEVDPLFLSILADEEMILDYTVYTQMGEV